MNDLLELLIVGIVLLIAFMVWSKTDFSDRQNGRRDGEINDSNSGNGVGDIDSLKGES